MSTKRSTPTDRIGDETPPCPGGESEQYKNQNNVDGLEVIETQDGFIPWGYWVKPRDKDDDTKEHPLRTIARAMKPLDFSSLPPDKGLTAMDITDSGPSEPGITPQKVSHERRASKILADVKEPEGGNDDWLRQLHASYLKDLEESRSRFAPSVLPEARPERKSRSEEHCEDLSKLFPPGFPRFRVAENLNDIGAYLANASYFISLGGAPAPDLKYGIVAIPLGQERLLFSQTGEESVMTPAFLQAVQDAQFVDYADGSLYDLDGEDSEFQRRRFALRSETEYSTGMPLANPVIDPMVKKNLEKRNKKARDENPVSVSDPDLQAVPLCSGPTRGHAVFKTGTAPDKVNKSASEGIDDAPKSKRARTISRNDHDFEVTTKSRTTRSHRMKRAEVEPAAPKRGFKADEVGQAIKQEKVTTTQRKIATPKKPAARDQNSRITRSAARRG